MLSTRFPLLIIFTLMTVFATPMFAGAQTLVTPGEGGQVKATNIDQMLSSPFFLFDGVFKRNLTEGDSGSDVKSLQLYLNMYGFTVTDPHAPETEVFDTSTKNALVRFQAAYQAGIYLSTSLQYIPGVLDAATRAFIAKSIYTQNTTCDYSNYKTAKIPLCTINKENLQTTKQVNPTANTKIVTPANLGTGTSTISAAFLSNQKKSSCIDLNYNLRYQVRDIYPSSVASLQKFLGARGYFSRSSTGHFGPVTLEAVKKFQGDNAIAQTGFVGPLTRAKIKKLSCF